MTDSELLQIEIACALPDRQRLLEMTVPAGTTAREAVLLSEMGEHFEAIDLATCPIGVFGTVVEDSHVLRGGDRVEIYRPLELNPRDARRQAAASGKTMGRDN